MGLGPGVSCPVNLNSSLTAEQKKLYQNLEVVRKILNETRTIAMVGLSTERQKASYFVVTYLRSAGYRIIPVNPKANKIMGEKHAFGFTLTIVNCYPGGLMKAICIKKVGHYKLSGGTL